MNDKVKTRDHNIDVLYGLGFEKVRNTTVFKKGTTYILSPAVAENTVGGYWFDIRQVNLERIKSDFTILFVRIVPNLFIVEFLKDLSPLLSPKLMDNRPNSGNVWGIGLEIIKDSNKAFLFNKIHFNKTHSSDKFLTKLLNKEQAIDHYKKLIGQIPN
jgi:hypothetical protein